MAGRARRVRLTRERLLSTAAALADAEGIQSVTMRRLATEVGVEAMSLYHHLPGKDGLLDGLVERIVGEIRSETASTTPSGAGQDWSAEIRRRCLAARTVMVRHSWAPALISSRTAIPPCVYLHYETVLATFIDGGFTYRLAHRALHALGSMVLGFVQEPFRPASTSDGAEADPPVDLARLAEHLPHMAAMVAAEVHADDGRTLGWCDSQVEFEFTLDLLLEGLTRRLDAERQPHPPASLPRRPRRPDDLSR